MDEYERSGAPEVELGGKGETAGAASVPEAPSWWALATRHKLKWSPPPAEPSSTSATPPSAGAPVGGGWRRTRCSVLPRARPCRTLGAMVCRGGLKLKERLLVGVSAATVLFTLLLVVDLQMDAGMVGRRFVPNHARVKVGNLEDPTGAVYNGFRNRLLQKTHR